MPLRAERAINDHVSNYKLYSLKTNSWKVINAADCHPTTFPSSAYHGSCEAFYWIPIWSSFSNTKSLMWFDFCDETIRKINLPEYDDDDEDAALSLGSLNNSLVLYVSHIVHKAPCKIHTWVLKKFTSSGSDEVCYRWERQLSVLMQSHVARPINTGLNGEILFSHYYCLEKFRFHFKFGVYDCEKQGIRGIDIRYLGDPKVNKLVRVKGSFTYSESLLLLEEGDTY